MPNKEWQEIARLAQTGQRGKLMQFIAGLGPTGKMLAQILRIIGMSGPSSVEQAMGILKGRGYEVLAPNEQRVTPPPILPGNRREFPEIAAPEVQKVPSVRRAGDRTDTIDTRRVAVGGGVTGAIDWTQTPHSSNVYAFAFDPNQDNDNMGILYVQFKAPGASVSKRRGTNRCTGEDYNIYHRAHSPGPIYAYGGAGTPVPRWVYNQFQSSSSPGGMVWEHLRQCGSLHGHQYPYVLVAAPAVAGTGFGYVPRRVIEKDERTGAQYRPRTVPQVGFGRRAVAKSTIQSRY